MILQLQFQIYSLVLTNLCSKIEKSACAAVAFWDLLVSFSDSIIFCADVQSKILPGVTHWQSPDYFAYFPSNSSVAGFLGEMLSAGINMVGFSWITSPAATELEMIVLDWLAKALKLPDQFLSTGTDCSLFWSFGFISIRDSIISVEECWCQKFCSSLGMVSRIWL